MTKFADSVKQAATLTSTATITPGAASTGYRTLAQAIADTAGKPEQVAVGDTVCMRVDDVTDPTKFEIAEYTISGTAQAPTLTRTTIRTSSAGGTTPVTFGGPVTILCTAQASYLASLPIVRDIPFSQAVPLSVLGASYMPQQTVSGALTFTPAAGAVRGALSYLRLVADGANTPDFSAFKESVSSGGYDNRAGIVNAAQFFYDGYDYWFSVFEALNATPIATSLTLALSSSSTPVGSPVTVTVGVNSPLTGSQTESVALAAPVSGTWSANPVTLNAGMQTVSPTFTPSATGSGNITASASGTPTVAGASSAYTASAAATAPGAPTIGTAAAGNGYVDVAFTAPSSNGGSAIANNTATLSTGESNTGTTSPIRVTAANGTARTAHVTSTNGIGTGPASAESNSVTPMNVVRLSPRSSDLSESASMPYIYTGTGAAYSDAASNYVPYPIGGVATQKLQSGQNGSLSFKFTGYTGGGSGAELMLGLSSSASVVGFKTLDFALFAQSSGGKYAVFTSGNTATVTNSVSVAVGDIMRISRSGTSVIAEVSKDGTNYTPIYTWNNVSTSAINFQCVVGTGPGTITSLVPVGLA